MNTPKQTMSTEFGLDPQAFARFTEERNERIKLADIEHQERIRCHCLGLPVPEPTVEISLADLA